MDLKSMLNDSAQRPPPPRIHTSTSSVSDRPYDSHTPYEADPSRPTPLASTYPSDGRAPGSYFAVQSPQQHSASTPSAGAHSAHSGYTQSPGPGGAQYTPRRDSVTPQHVLTPGYVPPPSPMGAHPQTPGVQYHPGQTPLYAQAYTPQSAVSQRPPTREDYPHTNGRPLQPQTYHMSPPPPHHQQTPSTPLGPPPTNYARPSIHSQRPPSQGYDHLRRASIGSMGSNHSRDPSLAAVLHHEPSRASSIQRTPSDEDRLRQERERSDESVSPKTIPRPPPQRTSSTFSSHPYEQSPATSVRSQASSGVPHIMDQQAPPPITQNHAHQHPPPLPDQRPPPQPMSRPSPGAKAPLASTPQSAHSSLPPQPSPPSSKPPSKKRTASVISALTPTSMPPQKRIKREEKPIWAQSMRKRPLRLGNNPRQRQPRAEAAEERRDLVKQEDAPRMPQNGPPQPRPQHAGLSHLIDKPRNDLLFIVGEWIYQIIGTRTPPRGSVFEIEAKLGLIIDHSSGREERIRLPVISEAVFDKNGWPGMKTKFATVMSEVSIHLPLSQSLASRMLCKAKAVTHSSTANVLSLCGATRLTIFYRTATQF
jgi:hypothetical protein